MINSIKVKVCKFLWKSFNSACVPGLLHRRTVEMPAFKITDTQNVDIQITDTKRRQLIKYSVHTTVYPPQA
jgi:hypothetical protein